MWLAIGGFWSSLDVPVRAAAVSGVFTILAAVGGVLIVFIQLRRQAANTARATRHTEALKLKKEVYEEFVGVCREGADAAGRLYHYVQRFGLDVGLLRDIYTDQEKIPDELIPTQRYKVVRDLSDDLAVKVSRVVRAVQRWQIINPRFDLFKIALNFAMFDVQAVLKQYHLKTMVILPFGEGSPLDMEFKLPSEEGMQTLFEQTDNVCQAVARVQQWIADMQVELQNELLGELFSNRIKLRADPEPSDKELEPFKVLRLDRHDELVSYFQNETEWGRQIKAMSAEMSEDELSTPPLSTEPRAVRDLRQ